MDVSLRDQAVSIQHQLVAWRRELHACPELKDQTFQTAKILVRELNSMGIHDVQDKVGGSGVIALIHGKKPGKCLGIRADCDGLPIPEETGLPFASRNGNMHACGHDAHSAMVLGAAELIQNNRDQLMGSVKLIFQPYEEGDGGAKAMLDECVLDNPQVDAMIALHIGNIHSELDSGKIGWIAKPSSFCITGFKAVFHGKGTHVATPHLGVDPIYIACNAVIQMQAILSREKDPSKQVIIAVCKIEGGSRNNIIPESCVVEGSIRSNNKEDQKDYYKRISEIFTSVAFGLRGSVDIEMVFDLMASKNNPEMIRRFLTIAPLVIEPEKIEEITKEVPVGEDFARFAERVPSLYFFLSSKPKNGTCYPHHHPKFDIDESDLISGTAMLTAFALNWQTI